MHPRIDLAGGPTPLQAIDRLGAALGKPAGTLFIKRDDLTALAGGGNKARKLEFLCADALAQGCDTLVTGGGRQSNHVRMTAAAANKIGLACTIVISSEAPAHPSGNIVLDYLLRPEFEWAGKLDYYRLEDAIGAVCDRLVGEGRRPYRIPIGGASALGALGYVVAAVELEGQLPGFDAVVVAAGSGGTHAGLVAGLGDHARVLGVDVGARPDLDAYVPAKASEAAALAGRPQPVGEVQIDHDRFGDDYGAVTDDAREALDLAARLEGVVLDPVYTGKAMAGLIAACRDGRLAPDDGVVFLHTGGMPALFAATYADWVKTPPPAGAG